MTIYKTSLLGPLVYFATLNSFKRKSGYASFLLSIIVATRTSDVLPERIRVFRLLSNFIWPQVDLTVYLLPLVGAQKRVES